MKIKTEKYKLLITTLLIMFSVIAGVSISGNSFYKPSKKVNVQTTKITVFRKAYIPKTTKSNHHVSAPKKKKTAKVKKVKSKPKKKRKEVYQVIRGYTPPKNVNTSFKSYMCYRTITCVNSNQYILQKKAHTDKNGIRCIGNDVCIALGTRYTTTIGDRFLIELDTGKHFTAIVGDIKSDAHTDKKTHSYIKSNGNVVEFIVDDKKISNDIKFTGNISCIDKYNGQIKALVQIY